jgi:hypothetical protein
MCPLSQECCLADEPSLRPTTDLLIEALKTVQAGGDSPLFLPPASLFRVSALKLLFVDSQGGSLSSREPGESDTLFRYRGMLVTVKELEASSLPDVENTMRAIKPAPNVITIFGTCDDAYDGKRRIVTEHCAHGSLREYIKARAPSQVCVHRCSREMKSRVYMKQLCV